MIAVVIVAFAAHIVAWLFLPESNKSAKYAAEPIKVSGAIQASAV